MHPFFEPLDDREAMLLLTTLTVGGSEEIGLFQHLPQESRGRLEQKAQALLEIPTEKRVPFMVHEMKQALSTGANRGVERIDPTWILQGLKGESARVVACVLITLPTPTVRSVLKRLPPGIRQALPPKNEIKRVPLELVRAVREIFENRFDPMPRPTRKGFAFRDILQLERNDLFSLMRALGLVELSQAFVSVGPMALAEFCRRLPRDKAEELILAVRSASHTDLPDLKAAQRFLAKVVVDFRDTEELFQKSGMWRIARASLLEDESFASGMRQRLPKGPGELFVTFVKKVRESGEYDASMLQRLQDSILVRVVRLARDKAIDARWAEAEMSYFDAAGSIAALDERPSEPEAMGDPRGIGMDQFEG